MTIDEENEYLYTQYVLTLKNDGDWYRATRKAVADQHYGSYADVTWGYLIPIMQDNGDCSTRSMEKTGRRFIEFMMRRVALVCWHEEDAFDFDKSKLGRAYRDCVGSLKEAGLLPRVYFLGPSTAKAEPEPEQPSNPETESPIMNPDNIYKSIADYISAPAPAFQTLHLVYGQNVDSMPAAALITAIKQVENEINSLKAVATPSTKIAAMIEDLTSMLNEIVKTLDAKA